MDTVSAPCVASSRLKGIAPFAPEQNRIAPRAGFATSFAHGPWDPVGSRYTYPLDPAGRPTAFHEVAGRMNGAVSPEVGFERRTLASAWPPGQRWCARVCSGGKLRIQRPWPLYAELCGRTLAHTHAKSGDAVLIRGYLGKADTFDHASGNFAAAYAGQNVMDHAALVAAVS